MATRPTNAPTLWDEPPSRTRRRTSPTSPRKEKRSAELPFRTRDSRMNFEDYEQYNHDYSQQHQLYRPAPTQQRPDRSQSYKNRARSPSPEPRAPAQRSEVHEIYGEMRHQSHSQQRFEDPRRSGHYAVHGETRQRSNSQSSLESFEDYESDDEWSRSRPPADASTAPPAEIYVELRPGDEERPEPSRWPDLQRNLKTCIVELTAASSYAARSSQALLDPDFGEQSAVLKPAIEALNDFADRLREQSLRLEIWSHEADVFAILAADKGDGLHSSIGGILQRLTSRVRNFQRGCEMAQPDDFERQPEPLVPDDDDIIESSDDEGEGIVTAPEESLGYEIEQDVRGIELQVRTLQTLTRAVKTIQPDEKLQARILEVDKYFGSDHSCKMYHVNPDYFGHKALVEARKVDAGMKESRGFSC